MRTQPPTSRARARGAAPPGRAAAAEREPVVDVRDAASEQVEQVDLGDAEHRDTPAAAPARAAADGLVGGPGGGFFFASSG